MKKIITILICLLLSASMVLAANSKGDQGMAEPELREAQGNNEAVATKAVVQNEGVEKQVRVQTKEQLNAGNYMTEKGEKLQVQQQSQNRIQLKVGNSEASSSLKLTQEQTQEKTRLRASLSNGKDVEIKVMPDTAAQKAQERLRLKSCNDCSIELKEVGEGEQVRAAYQVQAQKQSKVFGLFSKQMNVQAQINAENGEVIQAKKPWWAFLASE